MWIHTLLLPSHKIGLHADAVHGHQRTVLVKKNYVTQSQIV